MATVKSGRWVATAAIVVVIAAFVWGPASPVLVSTASAGPVTPIVLDEEAAALGGPGWGGNSNEGYNHDIRYSNNASATATWTFTGLADGPYDVLASWTLHPNRSSDISYTIGGGPAVHVNQERFGTGIYMQGIPVSTGNPHLFAYLDDPVTVSGGTLTVTASNNRSGSSDYLIADAIAIRPAGPRAAIIDNNSAGFTTDFPGGNNAEGFLPGSPGGYHSIKYTAPNASSAGMQSTWTFDSLDAGAYKVYATWSTHPNRTQAAPYSLADGSGPLSGTIPVNQEAAPFRFAGRDLNLGGVGWRNLGSYRVADGTLAVKLNGVDNSSGTDYVIADAVRIEPIPATAHVPWIGVFRAGSPAGSDPWYFTQQLTRPHLTDATNPGWGAGTLGDQPIVGDWDGDGCDDIGVFRSRGGNTWYFANDRTQPITSFSSGPWGAGSLGDIAVAGDWDGDGTDGIGVFRTSVGGTGTNWFLADNPASPATDYQFHYGAGALGDLPVVGDWDGDGIDTVGVFRTLSGTWYLNNGFTDTTAYQFMFGQIGDIPVAEDWDGDGMDDIGLFRPSTGEWFLDTNFDGIADIYNAGYGSGALGDVPVAGHFVPEPATLALLALGLLPILRRRRR